MGHLNSQKMKAVDLVLFTVVKILQKYCKGHLIYSNFSTIVFGKNCTPFFQQCMIAWAQVYIALSIDRPLSPLEAF